MSNDPNQDGVGAGNNLPNYFQEIPAPHESHPRNYIEYLGGILSRFRRHLPKEEKNQTAFGEILGRYFGAPVDRNRIGRAEKGDPTVGFGVIAAYLHEMGAWPKILDVLEQPDGSNLHYMMLIYNNLEDDISKAQRKGMEKLNAEHAKQTEIQGEH